MKPTRPDILLILRTPPPWAGGEMINALLERHLAGRFRLLPFRRPRHRRAAQGKVSRANVSFAVRFVATSVAALVRHRPRVLYVDLPKDGRSFVRNSAILVVAFLLRVRVVGDVAGADFQFLQAPGPIATYGRFLLRRVAVIRVLGADIARTLSDHGLDNAEVLSNGIDEPPGAKVDRSYPAEPSFLYVGKLADAKGVTTLVEYMSLRKARSQPGLLHLVGEWESPAYEEATWRRIEELGVQSSIVVHGLRVGDEKWELFRACDVLLHPTRWDGQPVTILEGLAFGLPVVATKIGAIPDTIDDGVSGRLMKGDSPQDLGEAVDEILADESTYLRYSSGARTAFMERFVAERFVENIAALLERVSEA
jgi:glycosyltransferase involved in cell wall biosynthesis